MQEFTLCTFLTTLLKFNNNQQIEDIQSEVYAFDDLIKSGVHIMDMIRLNQQRCWQQQFTNSLLCYII